MRIVANIAIALGLALVAWVAVTIFWQEPVTAVEHHRAVVKLKRELRLPKPAPAKRNRSVAPIPEGHAIGRLKAPGIDAIIVSGAGPSDLVKGPGMWHSRPGLGKTTVISGHRTTYGAPFRHIDGLKVGDRIEFLSRQGTFRYVVMGHKVVTPDQVQVARNVGFDQLVLTACHPVYSASHRYIVFARRA